MKLAVPLDRQKRPEQRHAADEVVGAVDRVDVPAGRGVAGLGPVLLADEAVIRVGRRDACAYCPLDRGVGLGHEGAIGLGRDLEVAPEGASGELVGLVAGRLSNREPGVELHLGPSPETRRPLRAVGGLPRHERNRSPAGSQSGSLTTSKPIHSPKTSISPRVPIPASGGR